MSLLHRLLAALRELLASLIDPESHLTRPAYPPDDDSDDPNIW